MIASDWEISSGRHALNLTGTDYIDFGASAADVAGPISVSVWIRKPTLQGPGTNGGILSKGNIRQAWPGTSYCMSLLGYSPQNIVSWAVFDDTNNGRIGYYSSDGIVANVWTHIVGTYNGIGTTNAATQLFIANQLKSMLGSEDVGSFVSMTRTSVPLEIGRRPFDAGYEYSSFLVDDVRIYNRVLSRNEITLLASRRGIAYDLAPRRRAALVAGFNRRRRLLVGAHS
jgi:hypothetical protein